MADVQTPVDAARSAATSADDGEKSSAAAAGMRPAAAAFAGKANDLDALRNAVVDAANVGAGLWFSYLFVLLYLIVAVGGVTHRNLLFDSPVKLPFVGVDLPLVGFFVLGPALFLIVHAYVLLHFAMLADKVGVFHAELRAQIADDEVRAQLRRQLPSNIFVQFLAGPIEMRSGLMGTMLRLIAQISLVVGPLALMVFFQLQFLPYHNEAVSWWHRIAVVADLALLWALWPSVARGERSSVAWHDLRRPHVAAAAVASLAPILLVFIIATFPDEWLDRNPISAPIIPRVQSGAIRWITPHEFLVGGDVDLVAAKPTSIWFNRMVLPGLELKPGDSVSLRGRNLDGAVLLGAKLRSMDFTATSLRGAVLNQADLRDAKFPCTDTRLISTHAPDERPDTAGTQCARLQNAFLVGAMLEGAEFEGANMQGATLDKADLRGANLASAQLEGASLDNADLRGASLIGAQLHGATLRSAQLQGAALDHAQMQAAYLDDARLQGASLLFTGLQGASLRGVRLGGALLEETRLHGATLDAAYLDGASFQSVMVWRARTQGVRGVPLVVDAQTAAVPAPPAGGFAGHRLPADCIDRHPCEWNAETFAALRKLLLDRLPPGSRRDQTLARIAVLDPATSLAGEQDMAKQWAKRVASPPDAPAFNKIVVDLLRGMGCAKEGAPYIVRRWLVGRNDLQPLAAVFLDDASCPSAATLSDADRAMLRSLRDG